jgi:hypothetical protein
MRRVASISSVLHLRGDSMVRLCALLCLLPLLSGCGEDRPSSAVSGTVTIDGRPMAGVIVRFQPVGTGASPKQKVGMGSYGKTDADGRFRMYFSDNDASGAVPGEHIVVIDELTPPEEENNDAGFSSKAKSRIPKPWKDGSRRFTVKDGANEATFDLSSRKEQIAGRSR